MYPTRYRANDAAMRLGDEDILEGTWDWFYMPKGIRNLVAEFLKKWRNGDYRKTYH